MRQTLPKALAILSLLWLTPVAAIADNGIYVSASIGSASLSEDFDGFDVDSDSTAFRLILGWRFNQYVSIEGGYHNFGEFEQTFTMGGQSVDISLEADGFTLGGTGRFPVSELFALFGRAGAFFWDGDAQINNVSQATPEDTNLYIGIGATFEFAPQLELVTDWTRYKLEDTESDVISLGMVYRF